MVDTSYIYAQIKINQICIELKSEGFSAGDLVKAQIDRKSKAAYFPSNYRVGGLPPNDCVVFPGDYEVIKTFKPKVKKPLKK